MINTKSLLKSDNNKVYAYIRVSTDKQEYDRQINILKDYYIDETFEEKISGTKKDRPQLNQMLNQLQEGDVIIVESWSRLGRSLSNLVELVNDLENKGVTLLSTKEGTYNPNDPQSKLMFNIFASLAEFERDLLSQRTKEGLKASKNKGGRPRVDPKKIETALALKQQGYTQKQIKDLTGVGHSTLHRYIKEKEEK